MMWWQQELNIPIILATHDRSEAFEMGGRIAILGDRRFQQIDTYRNLLNNPANDFVSDFMGGANIVDCAQMKALSAQMKALSPAGGAISPNRPDLASNNFVLPIEGKHRFDEDLEGGALVGDTFLGRPIRLELRHHHEKFSNEPDPVTAICQVQDADALHTRLPTMPTAQAILSLAEDSGREEALPERVAA